MNKMRLGALLICAFLCFVTVASLCFIVLGVGHNCTGHDCHVCAQVRACIEWIRDIAFVLIILISGIAIKNIAACVADAAPKAPFPCSPVRLRVKLLN